MRNNEKAEFNNMVKENNYDWQPDNSRQDRIVQNTIVKHQNETKNNYDIVRQQLERKQFERQKDAEFLRKSIEQRFQEDDFNRKIDKLQREETKKTQQQYQEMLNKQIEIKRKMNLGTMTHMEKKLNKSDLHGYKMEDRHVHSLIPGINHFDSIGSKPT